MAAIAQPSERVVDEFVLGEALNVSAMAGIYRVVGTTSGRALPFPAIMKIPSTHAGEGGEGILGFETETCVLSALAVGSAPRVLAKGDITKKPYLVLEYIAGESIEKLLADGRMTAERVAAIGAAVADALHAIHTQGVIHFDLKPENVILRPSGEAALIDFGMARHARFPDLLAEERRFASGSAPYISPEQVLGNRNDARSDLYSLGVMLYEMSTGALPFGAPRSLAGLRDRIWLDPPPPRMLVTDIPPWLQEIILRCLEPDARDRYASAAHVAFDLRHPEQVPLTDRAEKRSRAGFLAQAGRWWRARKPRLSESAEPAPHAPVIMVAVDTMHPDDPRHPQIQRTVERITTRNPEFRLVCVSVVGADPVAAVGKETGVHLEHLVRLRHWTSGLGVPENRLSLHVIEALNPSSALLDFARHNNVSLIVIGAPAPGDEVLGWWRSVASTVTANAHCSVYVVRIAEARG